MTASGSPCGACKFLRRKCARGCVFAPYFCHEQGPSHFAAIHKVFGASNASKLLAQLPASNRCEAATTICYEAQARLQDPIYGCVSHIFALQRQIVNLQSELASLKAQAAVLRPQIMFDYDHMKISSIPQQINYPNYSSGCSYASTGNHENSTSSVISGEDASIASLGEMSFSSLDNYMHAQWGNIKDFENLQSVAFGYSTLRS